MKINIGRMLFLCAMSTGMLMSVYAQAQRTQKNKVYDSLESIKVFMLVCNSYKVLPLQMHVKMMQQANVITAKDDTITTEANFFIENHSSYIRMGETEQVVNDSLIAVVNHRLKRILVYRNDNTVMRQMESYIGIQLQDSMAQQTSKKFRAAKFKINDTLAIRLDSRRVIARTLHPKETVEIKYNPVNMQPYEVMHIKREIIKISQEAFISFSGNKAFEGKLFELDNEFYAVKELCTFFKYESLRHQNENVPVTVSDRVKRNKEGEWTAALGFEDYILKIMN